MKRELIKRRLCNLLMRLCSIFPLENKVVLMSFWGKGYSDNPKALYEEMIKIFPEYKYVWLLQKDEKIPFATVTRPNSIKSIFELATAKLWIDNSRKRDWIYKRKGQIYVQTWHAGLTVKKVEEDAEDKLSCQYLKDAKHDSSIADYFISGCKWSTEKYKSSFWYKGRILEFGQPRSDIFYKDPRPIVDKVKKFYKVGNCHLILYAPTFRVDVNLNCYNMDYERVLKLFHDKFGGEWKLLIRLHPNIQKHQNVIHYSDDILNGSKYDNINELIVSCDCLITDYSSCCFDAMEAHKMVFLYASDYNDYMKDRGTYFDLQKLPASLSQSIDTLIDNINKFDYDKYLSNVEKFESNYGIFNCADSSEKICRYLLQLLSQ